MEILNKELQESGFRDIGFSIQIVKKRNSVGDKVKLTKQYLVRELTY